MKALFCDLISAFTQLIHIKDLPYFFIIWLLLYLIFYVQMFRHVS